MKILPLTLVQLDLPESYEGYFDYYENLLNVKNKGAPLLCLGEISNMPDHYAVVSRTTEIRNGKIEFGLHSDIFRVLTDEET